MTVRPCVGEVCGNREREGWRKDKTLSVENIKADED